MDAAICLRGGGQNSEVNDIPRYEILVKHGFQGILELRRGRRVTVDVEISVDAHA